jgi:hypothetical protein
MNKYSNSTGNSIITHYEIGEDYIRIQYTKRLVEYTVSSNSKEHIEEMKVLAKSGLGLYRFIRKNKIQEGVVIQKTRTSVFQRLKLMLSLI